MRSGHIALKRRVGGRLGCKAGFRSALETPELEVEDASSLDVPWNVVVHNDPVNLMSYVSKVFRKVFGFSEERAHRHMMEVHQRGRSVVWTGSRERAEMYVQKLQGYLLLSTMERSL